MAGGNLAPFWVPNLEDQGDLISSLTMGIIGVATWIIGVVNLLASEKFPPSIGTC